MTIKSDLISKKQIILKQDMNMFLKIIKSMFVFPLKISKFIILLPIKVIQGSWKSLHLYLLVFLIFGIIQEGLTNGTIVAIMLYIPFIFLISMMQSDDEMCYRSEMNVQRMNNYERRKKENLKNFRMRNY